MTTMLEMPRVGECSAQSCAYNTEHACHAFAISVGDQGHAHCGTFTDLDVRGGLPDLIGQVGACQKADCVHNLDLECQAPAVSIGSADDGHDCLTYTPRS